MSDAGKPFTTGWKIAVVVALLVALANSGVDALREQEEQRFQNHEQRIDELEKRLRELQPVPAEAKPSPLEPQN